MKYIIFALFILGHFFGLSLAEETKNQANSLPPAKVELEKVELTSITSTHRFVGRTNPLKRSVVAAEEEGKVVRFIADRGRSFKKGELLAKLDDSSLKIQLKIAQAEQRQAEAELKKSEIDLERAESLVSKAVWSERELTNGEADYQIAKEYLENKKGSVDLIRDQIRKTSILAPFNGIVLTEMTQIGEWLDKGGDVVEFAGMDPILVVADVSEKFITKVQNGMEVSIQFISLNDDELKGTVVSIVPQGSEESHTFPVEINLPNPNHLIKLGMLCDVYFGKNISSSFLVPKDAVVTRGSSKFVFVVREDKAVQLQVTVGPAKGEKVLVNGNLKNEELVVVRGNERLFPGQPVIPVKF